MKVSPNRKLQWGIVVGEPYPAHRNSVDRAHIGEWCSGGIPRDGKYLTLYFTRREAEVHAKQSEKYQVWHYHAKKYVPKRKS